MRIRPLVLCLILALLFTTNPNFKVSTSEPISNMSLSYEQNLTKAAEFLNSTQFNQTVGLCREAPNFNPNTYWLVSDNLLAYHALKHYYPETAEKIQITMKNYGYFRSFKHEVIFGTTIPYIPFRNNTAYVLDQNGNATVKTEVCNRTETLNTTDYADLCIFAALHYHWIGNESDAVELFNTAKHMWDGKGLYDNPSLHAEGRGEPLIYSTFKLALLLYASRILNQPLENKTDIEEVLWRMQDVNGGLHTDYDANLNFTGSDVNTETTALTIIAYEYEPKIMNRPASYPSPLNVPPDYEKIQDAINGAVSGDAIRVSAGIYHEHIVLGKALQLIGEEQNATIIDGEGIGSVIQVDADNVSIVNFTIRNAGRNWGPPPRTGYPDSCILGSGVTHIRIEDNILTDAAVCVWFVYSSFVNVSDNVVFDATYAGVIGYASLNITMYRNLVHDCGWMGIHLDGSSNQCIIADNTVMNNLEGMELERSAGNLVDGNSLVDNNVSIVLNRCGSLNVFRGNNMTSSQCNLIVFGFDLDSFMQDLDDSNIVNNKTVYYLTNLHDIIIDPSDYPNLGYLAVVNCTNTTVQDFNITRNGDGVLLAYSTKCTLTNITLSGNRGSLLCGGLTFYKSNNNTIVNNKISNNTCAICLYHSDENIFYHNNFIQNDRQVVPDFLAPFTDESSGYFSLNVWDNNFEGNYWSDYTGLDENKNGIGDSSYLITPSPSIPPESKQYDRCPLMGMFHSYDVSYVVSGCKVKVVSNSTISDFAVPIWIEHPELRWIEFKVTGETGIGFCRICIPYKLMSPPYNVTIDNGETPVLYINDTICDNGTHRWMYFTYPHTTHKVIIIPEFLSNTIVAIFMITSLITAIMAKKRRKSVV